MQTKTYASPEAPLSPPIEPPRQLARATDGRLVGGVCAGLADFYGIDPIIPRVIFVVTGLAGFSGVAIYALMWALLPVAGQVDSGWRRGSSRLQNGQVSRLALSAIAVLALLLALWGAAVVAALVSGFVGSFNAIFDLLLLALLAAFGAFCGWLLGGYRRHGGPAPGLRPPTPLAPRPSRTALLIGTMTALVAMTLGAPLVAVFLSAFGLYGDSVAMTTFLRLLLWTAAAGTFSWFYFVGKGSPAQHSTGSPRKSPNPASPLLGGAAVETTVPPGDPRIGPRIFYPGAAAPADADGTEPPAGDEAAMAARLAREPFDLAAAERASATQRAAAAEAADRAARQLQQQQAREARRSLRIAQRAERRHKNRWGRLVAGVGLITAGVLATLDAAGSTELGYLGIGIICLGVLALGILVGAWFGSARWLIFPALVLAVVLACAQWVVGLGAESAVVTKPTADSGNILNLPAGNNFVDLTEYDSKDFTNLQIWQTAGSLTVLVPDDPKVTVRGTVVLGRNLARGSSFGVGRTFSDAIPGAATSRLSIYAQLVVGTLGIRTVESQEGK